MPRFTTDVKSTPGTNSIILLGPYLVYHSKFAEPTDRKAERYLAVDGNHPEIIQFDVDTKAASFVLDPVPDTHNQYFIYTSRAPGDTQYHVLNTIEKTPGKYVLGIKSVDDLKDVTQWTAEHGGSRNKYKFSTVSSAPKFTPLYWVVTREQDNYTIQVRDLGSGGSESEFALEELDLL